MSSWRRISLTDVDNAGTCLGVAMTVLERYEAGRLRVDDPENLIQVLQNVGLWENRRDKRRA